MRLNGVNQRFGESVLTRVQDLASTVAASGNEAWETEQPTTTVNPDRVTALQPALLSPAANSSDAQVWAALGNLEQDS